MWVLMLRYRCPPSTTCCYVYYICVLILQCHTRPHAPEAPSSSRLRYLQQPRTVLVAASYAYNATRALMRRRERGADARLESVPADARLESDAPTAKLWLLRFP